MKEIRIFGRSEYVLLDLLNKHSHRHPRRRDATESKAN